MFRSKFFSVQSSFFKIAITFVSQIWVAAVGIVFMPIYVRIIGVESYGLVAFYTTLTTSLVILDLGLRAAVSRQLAIMQASGNNLEDQRNLLFSAELIYWITGFLLGLAIIILSYPIATHWVNSRELPVNVIQRAVMLMGVCFAFQWPTSVYTGSLIGLQRQSELAFISIFYTTIRAIGIVLGLKWISGTITSYFMIQTIMTIAQVIAMRYAVWKRLHYSGHRPHFSKKQISVIRVFATGMTGISLVSFFLSQIDKIIVSKILLLEFVGYYNLAFVLANLLTQFVAPMQMIFFPKFSALVATNQETELSNFFSRTARWVSISIIPAGVILVLFSKEILLLWTKNPVLAENTAPILRFATLGTVCNCLMWVPYYYMLARGNTKFSIYQNIIASIILTPLLFWWTRYYGAVGASLVWFSVNLGYIIFSIPLFHRIYFKGHMLTWYINNLILPVLITAPLALVIKLFFSETNVSFNYLSFGLCMVVFFMIYATLTREIRTYVISVYTHYSKRA